MQNASFFFAKMKNYLYLCGIKIKMKNDMKNIVDQVAKIFDKNIVRSILDSDLYKFSMQYWVIQHYPEAEAEYTFSNRDKSMIFDESAVNEILHQIKLMSKLRLTDNEYDWMKNNLPFLPVSYLQYLSAYRFNPSQVNITLLENGELNIKNKGQI